MAPDPLAGIPRPRSKPKRGRPVTIAAGRRIGAYLGAEHIAALDAIAEREGITRSAVLRDLIESHLVSVGSVGEPSAA